jgi:GNAT superfamily N-acetyltransferase
MRLERLGALPPDLHDLLVAARAEALGMVETLFAGGFAPFEGPGCALLAARDEARGLLGIGGVTRDADPTALRMRRFYVRPEARCAGIGRALAMALLDQAQRSGAGRVRLRAPAAAFAFWEACGLRRVAEEGATHAMALGARVPRIAR